MTDETFRFRADRISPESPRVKTFRLRWAYPKTGSWEGLYDGVVG